MYTVGNNQQQKANKSKEKKPHPTKIIYTIQVRIKEDKCTQKFTWFSSLPTSTKRRQRSSPSLIRVTRDGNNNPRYEKLQKYPYAYNMLRGLRTPTYYFIPQQKEDNPQG